MNVIFGEGAAMAVSERHTVLELDKFKVQDNVDAVYCVIETVPYTDLPRNQVLVELHDEMISDYRNQRWDECETKIDALFGSWNGEVDSFYSILRERILELKADPPGEEWDYVLTR